MHISKLRKPKHVIKLESTKFLLMTKYKITIDLHKINNKTSKTILISHQHSFQSLKILTYNSMQLHNMQLSYFQFIQTQQGEH